MILQVVGCDSKCLKNVSLLCRSFFDNLPLSLNNSSKISLKKTPTKVQRVQNSIRHPNPSPSLTYLGKKPRILKKRRAWNWTVPQEKWGGFFNVDDRSSLFFFLASFFQYRSVSSGEAVVCFHCNVYFPEVVRR